MKGINQEIEIIDISKNQYLYNKIIDNVRYLNNNKGISIPGLQDTHVHNLKKIHLYLCICFMIIALIASSFGIIKLICSMRKKESYVSSIEISKNSSLKLDFDDHSYDIKNRANEEFDSKYNKYTSDQLKAEKALYFREIALKNNDKALLKQSYDDYIAARIEIIKDLNYYYGHTPQNVYQQMKLNTYETDDTIESPKDFFSNTEEMNKIYSSSLWAINRKKAEVLINNFKKVDKN